MFPVFVGTNKQPSATLRLQEIRQESRRVGFFRIGIMPICLGEGVQVHLRTNQDSLAVLSRINGLLKPFAEHRALEFRRLEVFLPSEKIPCLSVDRVCCEANGQWRLTDGLTLRVGGETLRAKAGDFHVAGLLAGHVVLAADQGSRTIQLLGTAQETHTQDREQPCSQTNQSQSQRINNNNQ
jgi:hypothetical protein